MLIQETGTELYLKKEDLHSNKKNNIIRYVDYKNGKNTQRRKYLVGGLYWILQEGSKLPNSKI